MSASSNEQDLRVVNERRQTPLPLGGADPTLIALDQVRQQTIELLARLDRPPRRLHIEAGPVTVDITWDSGAASGVRPTEPSIEDVAPVKEIREGTATEFLRSPTVGVFYHASEPGMEPFVSVGSEVQPGQQIGIIEAMKLMIPIEADRSGRIAAVVKGNGEPVEYDEPLFALDAEGS